MGIGRKDIVSLSVVIPIYNTEEYLPDLLRGFEKQVPGRYVVEYIFVDDGSPDRSASIVGEWLDRTSNSGKIVRQRNSGASVARNVGIREAKGDWVTLPDSDDFVSSNYFSSIADLILASSKIDLVSCNVVRYDEENSEYNYVHPLKFKFSAGDRTFLIDSEPENIQSQAATAVFRREVIIENNLQFIAGLHVAEDAIFTAYYLLACKEPVVGVCKNAQYFYRIRAAKDSAVNTYKYNPDFYIGRFRDGYIPLLNYAAGLRPVPKWLQLLVLYDLRWYFPREMNVVTKASHLTEAEKQLTLNLVQEVLSFIEADSIINYRITGLATEIRALWLAMKGESLPTTGWAKIGDVTTNGLEISYLSTGEAVEAVYDYQGQVEILAAKTRRIDYFNQRFLSERIIWVRPGHGLRLQINNIDVPLKREYGFPQHNRSLSWLGYSADGQLNRTSIRPKPVSLLKQLLRVSLVYVASWVPRITKNPRIVRDAEEISRSRLIQATRIRAQTPKSISLYSNSWLLMDSLNSANDNAEFFYRYLQQNHPDLNIWFVLKKSSKDWGRLAGLGFNLIDYRSREHLSALLNANLIISSHLDVEIVRPIPEYLYPYKRPWQFVYLQHGVGQHNLSIWFNSKSIQLLTTASGDEYSSIVGDLSDYRLTKQTVHLTGFPRHDVVDALAQKTAWQDRNLILIAPTWRNSLFQPKNGHGERRQLISAFESTDFGAAWIDLFQDEEFRRFVESEGSRVVFLPHPAFRGFINSNVFPPYVELLNSVEDLPELLASARVTVTDYSAIFFDAAVAKSRIIYYQFDQNDYLNGAHTYTPGYWSYEKHGFGPIATGIRDAIEYIVSAYRDEDTVSKEKYQMRIDSALAHVDGNSSERILGHIKELMK